MVLFTSVVNLHLVKCHETPSNWLQQVRNLPTGVYLYPTFAYLTIRYQSQRLCVNNNKGTTVSHSITACKYCHILKHPTIICSYL